MSHKKPVKRPDIPLSLRIAVAYVRVSDQKGRGKVAGGREFLSPAIQSEEGGKHFAALGIHMDEELSLACRDISQSAFDRPWDARPGMSTLVAAALDGRVTDIYCYLKSRLGRDTLESLTLIRIFERAGVTLHFGDGDRDIADPDDKLFLTMELAFAEHESAKKRVFATAAARKQVLGGKPHGYYPGWIRRDPVSRAFVIDESKATIIRRAIALRLIGMGSMKISQALAAEGLRGPKGGLMHQGHILRLFSDHYLELLQGTHVYRGAGFEEPTRLPNAFPALITPDEALRLQHVAQLLEPVGGRTEGRKVRGKASHTRFLLSGIARCALCGGRLTAHDTGYSHGRAYICYSGRVDLERHGQRGLAVRAEQLEDAVLRVIRWVLTVGGVIIPEPLPTVPLAEPHALKRRRSGEETVATLTTKLDRMLAMNLAGTLPDEDYERNAAALIKKRSALLEAERKESVGPYQMAALEALASGNDRDMVLNTVEKVEAPLVRRDVVSYGSGQERRVARVTLRWDSVLGRILDAPLYRPNWQQEKEVLAASDDAIRDWRLVSRETRWIKPPSLQRGAAAFPAAIGPQNEPQNEPQPGLPDE